VLSIGFDPSLQVLGVSSLEEKGRSDDYFYRIDSFSRRNHQ
jgi:hypothetical protein